MLAKRTYKNQITLPADVVRDFPGVEYFDVSTRGGEIVLRPVAVVPAGERLRKVRDKIRALGLTESVVHDAIRWARKRA